MQCGRAPAVWRPDERGSERTRGVGPAPQQAPLRLWCQLPDFDQENVVSLTSVAIRMALLRRCNAVRLSVLQWIG